MTPENNSDPTQPATPSPQPLEQPAPVASVATPPAPPVTPVSENVTSVVAPTTPAPASPPAKPMKAKRFHMPKPMTFIWLVIFIAAVAGAFLLGRHHEKIVVKAPPNQPINLPPQAVVVANCVPGRGKQYIIPKDIPVGPIYDVENSKVIAIEYNLDLAQIEANPDIFSNAIIGLTQNYPADHIVLLPATGANASPSSVHLIMFVVTKTEANSITCGSTKTS